MSGTDLSREFGNTNGGLPFTVLIGADGQVRKTYLGKPEIRRVAGRSGQAVSLANGHGWRFSERSFLHFLFQANFIACQ
jgi:hypothetical protein